MILYVNGSVPAQTKGADTGSPLGTMSQRNWRIGTDTSTTPDTYFSGLIDDVRIYNRALSASEIQAMYNGGK
jgi:hypothetical protein